MKKNYMLFLLSIFFVCAINAQTTLTHSTDPTTIVPGTVSCQAGGITSDNTYYRSFDIATMGVSPFSVLEVSFGVENAIIDPTEPLTIDVVIYSATVDLPGAALTEIARVPVPIVDADAGTIKTVPIVATVTTNYLVSTIEIPDSATAQFSLASNNLGQSAPTYISSAGCSINSPTDMANVGSGFPDVHILMSVRDFVTLSIDDNSLEAISVYPNPTKDFIHINMANTDSIEKVELFDITGKSVLSFTNTTKINISNLSNGIYMLHIKTDKGSINKKVIKN
ncbi:T9SS type A sorting domain-containing protein [Lacinutrix himadriensis]|uniref:T9SS type A sorting domain-containing protein n=1 Tax=Lacinutrix himadriensis TaxID=641549 RepID=UPI0006E4218A|nr:T9SS type A sorting domain-containing protein [Lacinutrix himadriensis]